MEFNWKVFGIALAVSLVVLGIAVYAFMGTLSGFITEKAGDAPLPLPTEGIITPEDRKSLEIMTQKSARVNVLVAGTDGGRADTIMVMSYDPIRKLVDIVSIPRDTYHKMEGYNGAGMYKINASYALKGDNGGVNRVRKEVESILHIPIHYTVDLNYNAVRSVVDVLGGVDVDVKKAMKYDDPYCDPPLRIDLQPGLQRLDGDKAIQFLRWRKNNKGYGEGDIQRIERQQQFVKDAIAKAFGIKLPSVINAASEHIKTDMPLKQMLYYAGTSVGLETEKIQSYRLPGTTAMINHLSYFVANDQDTQAMMLAMYNRMAEDVPIEGTITTLKQLGLEDTKTVVPSEQTKTTESTEKKKKKTKTTTTTPTTTTPVDVPSEQITVTPTEPITTEPLENPTTGEVDADLTDTGHIDDISSPEVVPIE